MANQVEENIIRTDYSEEMQRSYIDYAMRDRKSVV